MKAKITPIDKTLTQVFFECPLCGEEYTYFTEAKSCVHNHLHSWCLVQTELEGTLKLDASDFIFIAGIKDILIKKIKLVMYKIDKYGIRGDVVYETTVEAE